MPLVSKCEISSAARMKLPQLYLAEGCMQPPGSRISVRTVYLTIKHQVSIPCTPNKRPKVPDNKRNEE
jgi:hypothetical protein